MTIGRSTAEIIVQKESADSLTKHFAGHVFTKFASKSLRAVVMDGNEKMLTKCGEDELGDNLKNRRGAPKKKKPHLSDERNALQKSGHTDSQLQDWFRKKWNAQKANKKPMGKSMKRMATKKRKSTKAQRIKHENKKYWG